MDTVNVIIVPAVVALMQTIKVLDKEDRLKKAYGIIALILSVVGGFGYAYLVQSATVDAAMMTAAVTYGAVQAIWAAKQATGVRIVGDSVPASSDVSVDNVGK